MSAFSINLLSYLIVAILLASVAVVMKVPTAYIVGAGVGVIALGLVTGISKQRSEREHRP